jgi:hypothetical protein
MKLSKFIFPSVLTICIAAPVVACSGDDGDSETNADTNGDGDGDGDTNGDGDGDAETTGPSDDIDCQTYCVAYIDICAANGLNDEFASDAECNEACEMWDQAGKNCRYDQINMGACDQAANAGTACN